MPTTSSASKAQPSHRRLMVAKLARSLAPRLRVVLLPLGAGGILLYFSFHAGGYFPGPTGLVAAVLLALIAAHLVLLDRPFAGFGWGYAITAGGLALFGLWTLASSRWSDAPARALVEFDRVVLYLAAFLFFGVLGRDAARLRWMVRGLALAASAVCLCALITRLLPDVWTLPASVANERLNYPLTYWNSLGLMAALGLVLCFALTTDDREARFGRVAAAGAIPVLSTTLLLTFSRGSIAACAIGLLALLVLGRTRALASGLLATVPTALVAVAAGYAAELLASPNPTAPAAAYQGHIVAVVVALCVLVAVVARWLLLRLDSGSITIPLPAALAGPRLTRPLQAVAGLLIVLGLLVWPVNLPHQYDSFVNGETVDSTDLRGRLATSGDNGRIEHWRAALEGFHEEPMHGTGAGTFALQWDRIGGSDKLQLQDAHSLYVEVLGELGIVGLLLIVGVIGAVLAGFLARTRDGDRLIGAALFAAGLTWALAAGVDWVWEMPSVTFWFFAAGGLALAKPQPAKREPAASKTTRLRTALLLAGGLACLALAIVPFRLYQSDERMRDGVRAFTRNDCANTVDRSLASIDALATRPEPYAMLGYCDVRLGKMHLAVVAMTNAVEHDPRSWEAHYGLAVAQAASGLDPRPELRIARRLNPRDSDVADTMRLLQTDNPQQWKARVGTAVLPKS